MPTPDIFDIYERVYGTRNYVPTELAVYFGGYSHPLAAGRETPTLVDRPYWTPSIPWIGVVTAQDSTDSYQLKCYTQAQVLSESGRFIIEAASSTLWKLVCIPAMTPLGGLDISTFATPLGVYQPLSTIQWHSGSPSTIPSLNIAAEITARLLHDALLEPTHILHFPSFASLYYYLQVYASVHTPFYIDIRANLLDPSLGI